MFDITIVIMFIIICIKYVVFIIELRYTSCITSFHHSSRDSRWEYFNSILRSCNSKRDRNYIINFEPINDHRGLFYEFTPNWCRHKRIYFFHKRIEKHFYLYNEITLNTSRSICARIIWNDMFTAGLAPLSQRSIK